MEHIRYVKIPSRESRTDPDSHVAYGLQVQGPVRSWTVWHRYRDFVALEYELSREFPGVAPPGPLPPKSLASWFAKLPALGSGGSGGDGEFVDERRRALERYIQSMILSDDDRWRTSRALQAFLAPASRGARLLAGKNGGPAPGLSRPASETESAGSEASWATPASWLADQRDAEQVVRDVRQSILRRESALTRNEVAVSHQALLEGKRLLGDLGQSIKALEHGLEQTKAGLTAGELLRRQDMLMRLDEDKANLARIVMGSGVAAGSSGRTALLAGASSGGDSVRVIGRAGASAGSPAPGPQLGMPGAMPARVLGVSQQGDVPRAARSQRVFGNANPPQETDETRGLDDRGLLQLQTDKMQEQDRVVAGFSDLLRRQREMGLAIGNELDLQNQLLTELDQDLDRTGTKLAAARRQANRL